MVGGVDQGGLQEADLSCRCCMLLFCCVGVGFEAARHHASTEGVVLSIRGEAGRFHALFTR